ncbi:MAG: bile acid:sodium symporter [Natronomonas sp.]
MLRDILDRYRNVLLVVGAVGVGLSVPFFGPYLEPLVTPLVIFLVFSSLRGLEFGKIDVSSYASLVVLSLCISYVVLPVAGIRLADGVLADGAVLGFAIALAVPTTAGSAIIWTRLTQGDVQLATITSISSLLVAPVVTPIVLLQLVGSGAEVPVDSILIDLIVIVGGGTVLAAGLPADVVSPRTIDLGATVAILLLIYTSVAGVEPTGISAWVLLAVVGVSALLVVLGLLVSLVCERALQLSRRQTLALFFTGSLKNLGIALLIALAYPDPLVVLSIITYYVVQQLSGAAISDAVG